MRLAVSFPSVRLLPHALLLPLAAQAFPDGAPWEAARQEGCIQCHFDAPPQQDSPSVTIEGLPDEPLAGHTYPLTIRLDDDDMAAAGFLLSAWQNDRDAGRFSAGDDGRVETNASQARSTEAGSTVASAGGVEWSVSWTAPERIDAPVVFDLWANSANGDRSPFEDRTHHRAWRVGTGSEAH